MDQITIIGIDCATDAARVGRCVAVERAGQCHVNFVDAGSNQEDVADKVASWLASATKALLALDAPLGWPCPMGEALASHQAGQAIMVRGKAVGAHALFRRETDRFVKKQLEQQPLDVGADRIARTAHWALTLLTHLRKKSGLPIPLAWNPNYPERVAAIEVYPAATLKAHGIPHRGYKKSDKIAERKTIIDKLRQKIQLPAVTKDMERNPDALDAAVCVLAGHDFLCGEAYPPENLELARHEGWIWVRSKLSRSAG
jgi:hypothetical protein